MGPKMLRRCGGGHAANVTEQIFWWITVWCCLMDFADKPPLPSNRPLFIFLISRISCKSLVNHYPAITSGYIIIEKNTLSHYNPTISPSRKVVETERSIATNSIMSLSTAITRLFISRTASSVGTGRTSTHPVV